MKKQRYAYTVMVLGKKRCSGLCTAGSMDEAAEIAARVCKLTYETPQGEYGQSSLRLDGKRAHLAIWAPAETMVSLAETEENRHESRGVQPQV